MADFGIDVRIDTKTSLEYIKSDINSIISTINNEKYKINVTINTSEAKKEIQSLQSLIKGINKTPINIKLGNGIEAQLKGTLTSISEATKAIKELVATASKIKVGFDSSSVDKMKSDIDKASKSVSKKVSKTTPSKVSKSTSELTTTPTGDNSLKEIIKDSQAAKVGVNSVNAALKEMQATNSSLYSAYKGIKDALGGEAATGQNATDVEAIKSKYLELQEAVGKLKSTKSIATQDDIDNVYRLQQQMQNLLTPIQERIVAEQQAEKAAQEAAKAEVKSRQEAARAVIKAAQETAKAEANAEKTAEKDKTKELAAKTAAMKQYHTVLNQLTNALKNYSAAEHSMNSKSKDAYKNISDARQELSSYLSAVNTGTASTDEINKATQEASNTLRQNASVIKTNGDAAKSLSDRLSGVAQKFSAWLSVSQVIMFAVRSVRQMISAAIEVDDAMTQMQIVTRATSAEMNEFADSAASAAQRVGSSITDFVDSATTFARLGYSMDESSQLAEFTAMLQNVGDIDVGDAQNAITAIVKAFGIDTSEIESVMDKLITTGNNFPISVSQIAEGMNNASSTLAASGNTFEQSVALLTAANTTIQDAAKSSTGLRTIAARIRNTKTELDELGESMSEANYEELVQALTDQDVALTNVNGEYRSTYDILSDIADKWDEMSSMEKAAMATALSGTRQQAVFYSIIEQFQEASGAMTAMSNSAGALDSAYETYMESTTFHINQFKAAFQELSVDVFQSDFLQFFIDLASNVISCVDSCFKLIDAIGGLRTILIAVAGTITTINTGSILNFVTGLPKKIKALGSNLSFLIQIPRLIAMEYKSANAATLASEQGISRFSAALKSLGISASAAQIGLGSLFAVITLGITLYSNWKHAQEEARQEAISAGSAAADLNTDISSLIYKYEELNQTVKSDSSANTELISTQDELVNKLGITSSHLDTLIEKYGNYRDAVKAAAAEKFDEQERDLRGAINARRDELLDAASPGIFKDSLLNINASKSLSKDNAEELEKAYDALKALEKAGYISPSEYSYALGSYIDQAGHLRNYAEGFSLSLEGDLSTAEGVADAYEQIGEMIDIVINEAGSENFVYDELYNTYNKVSGALNNYNDAINDFNTELVSESAMDKLQGMEIPDTQEEFDSYRQEIIDAVEATEQFIGKTNDIPSVVDNFLRSQSQFSGFFHDYTEEANTAEDALANAFSRIEARASELSEANKTLEAGISKVQEVLSAQSTGESLSVDDFNSEELKDYTSALEYSNGALQLNAERVSELVKAKTEEAIATNDENKAMAQSKYLDNAVQIEQYRKELENATGENAEAIRSNIDSLQEENDSLLMLCDSYNLMSASLREATDSYHNWLNSQNSSQTGDMFDDTLSAINRINATLNDEDSEYFGRVGRTDYQAALDLIIPEGVDREDETKINEYLNSIADMFTYDEKGNRAGLDIEKFCQESVDKGLMVYDKAADEYRIAGQTTMEDFAEGLNLSLPLVEAMFGEMQEFGGEFSWADEADKTIGDLAVSANVAAEKLRDLNEGMVIDLDVSDLDKPEEKVEALDQTIKQMQDYKTKVNIDSSEVEYANSIISYCVAQKQQLENPAILQVDASKVTAASRSAGEAISMLQEFKTQYNNLELQQSLGLNTSDAEASVEKLRQKIQSTSNSYIVNLGLNTSSVETLNQQISSMSLDTIKAKFNIDDTALVNYKAEDKKATVKFDIDTTKVDAYNPSNLYRTVTYYIKTSGTPPSGNPLSSNPLKVGAKLDKNSGDQGVNGTAHINGTAHAGGNWGVKSGGETLVGELGREIIVDPRTGQWYTVGDSGAEFVNIPKGSIIFNHRQTEDLLEHGYVAGRASAFINGTAMVTGGISGHNASKGKGSGGKSSGGKSSGGNTSTRNSSDNSSDKKRENKNNDSKIIDWIEIAIDRIERAIDRLATIATSQFRVLSDRLKASNDEISKSKKEIKIQRSGYDRYIKQARSVGLNKNLAKKVRNGTININEYSGETAEKIEEYQKWYEKALDCKDAIDELKESIAELYQNKFDDIAKDYENQLSLLEHLSNTYNNGISDLEERGYLASTKYYSELSKVEKQNIKTQRAELSKLTKAMSNGVNSGYIKEGSEAWYEMQQEINDVKESIQESETALVEFNNSIREIKWDYFDYLQEQISSIAEEADFLINLMENSDLYTDKGQLTDTGMATMGLHGQNYNTYMAQADKYAEEIERLNKEIATDPYNTKLLERREELLQSQRDSILAAEDEKQAIVDMVREGIELELDSLKELISKYTDALDSAKDLYDYQKKVKDQSSEIASLQKQLSAYSGDDSEEARATKQRIEVDLADAMESLEETEYDHYISEQKGLLDNLYDEYETVLNQRLDNIDALITDMIDMINMNAGAIGDTIVTQADSVGYTISQSLMDIWSNENGVAAIITKYGDGFLNNLTSLMAVINAISLNVQNMVAHSDTVATATISTATESTPTTEPKSTSKKSTSTTKKSTSKKSTSTTKKSTSKKRSDKDYYGVALAVWNGNYGWGNGSTRTKRLKAKGFDPNRVQRIVNKMEQDGYVFSNTWSGKYYGIKSLSPYSYSKFLNGGLVKYTGLAQLDGSPKKPEAVLNASDTKNFIALKDAMQRIANGDTQLAALFNGGDASAHIIKELSKIESPLAGQNTNIGNITYEVNIPIDHVDDYDDFMNQMRKDGKFEKFIQSMTVNRLAGGSKISKNKYNW